MTTKNTILTAIIDSVIFIPLEAIFNNDTMTYVYKRNGALVKQQVVLGLSNYNEIIVKEGLTKEDEVLLMAPEDDTNLDLITPPSEILEKYNKKEVETEQEEGPDPDAKRDSIRKKMEERGKGRFKKGDKPSGEQTRKKTH